MEHNTPIPVVKSFLVCRELFQDARTQQYILVGPLCALLTVPQVPTVTQLGVFCEITSCHGSYLMALQLRDMEDRVVWSQTFNQPFPTPDPLGMGAIAISRIDLCVLQFGKYDLVLLLNNEEVARRPLWVNFPKQPSA